MGYAACVGDAACVGGLGVDAWKSENTLNVSDECCEWSIRVIQDTMNN